MQALAEYLARVSDRGFAYGSLDCCIFMADWVMACGLPDPMADRRGRYASLSDYEAQMREEGGILKSCLRRFRGIGLHRTGSPGVGDVCLVKVPVVTGACAVALGATGAIRATERFCAVITADAGLVMAEMPIISAWKIAVEFPGA